MATVNFRELLKQNSSTVERPIPLPVGHYYAVITKHTFDESKQKKTPYVCFYLTPEAGSEDVAEEDLEGINLANKELRATYYITPTALYRLSDMLDGVVGNPDLSIDERIPETTGVRVLVQVTQRENEAKTEVYNDVGTIVAADSGYEEPEQAAAE